MGAKPRPATGETGRGLVPAAVAAQYPVGAAGGCLLRATAGMRVRWNRALDATSAWVPVADLSKSGVKNVSRLAVSPDGKMTFH